MKTAILVDGGFYRKRAHYLYGELSPEERADELERYCKDHIAERGGTQLYRVFYYDCMPISKYIYNPLTHQNVDFGKSFTYGWMSTFLEELKHRRKFALRLGDLSDAYAGYSIGQQVTRELLSGKKKIEDLTVNDLQLNLGQQKGVDMKIGLDIASLAYKRLVDQIILISGDSDFVPAAKLARREGIDFILDPMWALIKKDLFEHIDGLKSPHGWRRKTTSANQEQNEELAGEADDKSFQLVGQ